jgi:hypothetical protein
MPAEVSSSIIWNGQGPVHIGTYDPVNGRKDMGFLTRLYSVGCGNRTLTATPSREVSTIQESCSGQRLALKEIETAKSLAVSLEMVQFDSRTLAQAFYGEAAVQADGTVAGEELGKLEPGDYFFLRHPRSTLSALTDGSGTEYVEGEHYEVSDADHGRYRLLQHPSAHQEPLKADYDDQGYINIAAFKRSRLERGIIFSGINGDGQKVRVISPRISLAMSGDFGWITSEASALTLAGQALYVPELQADDLFGPFMRIDVMPDLN